MLTATCSPVERIQPVLNASLNGPALPLAELVNQPFTGTAVSFRVIAATCAVTERDDIPRDSSGAIRRGERYPVVGGESVPESGRAATDRAATAEMVECGLPVGGGEGVRKPTLAGTPTVHLRPIFIGVGGSPLASSCKFFLRVGYTAGATPLAHTASVGAVVGAQVFLVKCAPLLSTFKNAIAVGGVVFAPIRSNVLRVFTTIALVVLSAFFLVGLIPPTGCRRGARLAYTAQRIAGGALPTEIHQRSGFPFAAFGAALQIVGINRGNYTGGSHGLRSCGSRPRRSQRAGTLYSPYYTASSLENQFADMVLRALRDRGL